MIGFFDSGVGGLSVLRDVIQLMPGISTVYLADTANFPYGQKSEQEVQRIAAHAVEILKQYHPTAIVVACNTASTAALSVLRAANPNLPIVGVVPALKPAVEKTMTKTIALLATERTLASEAYRELKTSFAAGVTVIDQACPGWVELVEAGRIDDAAAETAVRTVIAPLVARHADTFVLGCTHYPFLRSLIARYAGPTVTILDSGVAVAQQLQRVIDAETLEPVPRRIFLTSGTEDNVSKLAGMLLGQPVRVEFVS